MPEFVKIIIGKTRLLLPRAALVAIESSPDIHYPDAPTNAPAVIRVNDLELPLYALDADLNFSCYRERVAPCCLCLQEDRRAIGIVCDDAAVMDMPDIKRHELPGCMQCIPEPVQHLVVCDDTVFAVTSGTRLFNLLDHALPSASAHEDRQAKS